MEYLGTRATVMNPYQFGRNSSGMSIIELLVVIGILAIVISGTSLLISSTQKSVNYLNAKFEQLSTMTDITARLKEGAQCDAVFAGTPITNVSNSADDADLESVELEGKVLRGIPLDDFRSGGIKISGIALKLISASPPEMTHRAYVYFSRLDGQDITPPLQPKYVVIRSQLDGANNIVSCVGSGGENGNGGSDGDPFSGGVFNGLVASVRQMSDLLEPGGAYHGFVVEAKIDNGKPYIRYRPQINSPFSAWEQTDSKNIAPFGGGFNLSSGITVRVTVAGLFVKGPTFSPNCGFPLFQTFAAWGKSLPTPPHSSVSQGFGSIDCSGGM